MKKLEVEYLATDKLIAYARNSRTHTQTQVDQIASSIKEFGFTNPILISETNDVIAGHCRLLAAQKLEMTTVPCIRLNGLTAAQKRAYVIADNRLALNARWDEEMLKLELQDLKIDNFDLTLLGFDDGEIDDLLALETEKKDINADIPWGEEIGPSDNYIVILCEDADQFERLYSRLGVPPRVRHNVSSSDHPDFELVGVGRIVGGSAIETELNK